ncbi:MAG: alkaline phosphatase family protein [Phycisphaerales bacterium JB037]
MTSRVAVILIVGLSESVLGERTPRLGAFARERTVRPLTPALPAVTTTSQACMLTGRFPSEHGIVGNGWYDRVSKEVRFWQQSNALVGAEKAWETARRFDPGVTCAKSFWWYNMYSSANWSVTPRPIYAADGRKFPDVYAQPENLRARLQAELGTFPLFRFWGPGASIESSRWIAEAAKFIERSHEPTLHLIYLPHLDYALQRFGPGVPEALQAAGEIDAVAGDLIEFLLERGVEPMIVSEYGIEPVTTPVFPNRALRALGMIRLREEQGGEVLIPGGSRAFAVCDHQIAHVYLNDPSARERVAVILSHVPGVERVLEGGERRAAGLDHERAGDLVLIAERGAWFAYPYWFEESSAPDFARTVDIHRKPGYDPCELFIDPAIRFPKRAIASRLLRQRLGFRTLMDLIPLDASLVKGSHGRVEVEPRHRPILIGDGQLGAIGEPGGTLPMTRVRDAILSRLFGGDERLRAAFEQGRAP